MINQEIVLDHVGWVTNNIELFEQFWKDIFGFEQVFESHIPCIMNNALFGFEDSALCRRYQRGSLLIEVHVYDTKISERIIPFNEFGLNHVALHVENRQELLKDLPPSVKINIYYNPKGWQNIFIQDFEGNWIELKETFK